MSLPDALGHARDVLVQRAVQSANAAFTMIATPDKWKASWMSRFGGATARVRDEVPLPAISGTIDTIPNVQSSILAHGLAYQPRPVFQDYAAYTPWLIEVNREHYRSARAASHLLFRPETIDGRFPLLDQGMAVNELLTYYDPVRFANGFLILERRAQPLLSTIAEEAALSLPLGQWQAVPSGEDAVLLSVDVAPNMLGRLASVLLRPPTVAITTRLADGTESESRLIPGMARSGFLLSPMIVDSIGFAALAIDARESLRPRRVVAFRIDTASEFGRSFYASPMKASFSMMRLDSAAAGRAAWIRPALRRQQTARAMADASPLRPPLVEARETEVFAHAPAVTSVPVGPGAQIRATFAIRKGAFTNGGATDGVCFRIAAETQSSTRTTIFERCLEPLLRPADGAEQSVEVASGLAQGGRIVFETTCLGNCAWDWSYWKDIDVLE